MRQSALHDYNTYAEVAAYCGGVSVRTVRRWVKQGKFGDPAMFKRLSAKVVLIPRENVLAAGATERVAEDTPAQRDASPRREPVTHVVIGADSEPMAKTMTARVRALARQRDVAAHA